jgi:hypothetical protein
MRILMLAAVILGTAAISAAAQTVIDVEGQTASPRAQDQDQSQSQRQALPPTQENAQPGSPGRYTFNRVDNGFLRLDNESGQVAYCSPRAVGWACEAVAVDRTSLETEIASLRREIASLKKLDSEIAYLQDEVASLKKEIAGLKEPAPPRPPADLTPSPNEGDLSVRLPTQHDIARARDYLEQTWRRLVEIIVSVQKDILRKG